MQFVVTTRNRFVVNKLLVWWQQNNKSEKKDKVRIPANLILIITNINQ